MNFTNGFDYLCIGCNGFAQVGDPEYWKKQKVEREVIMELVEERYPIPKIGDIQMFYRWQSFPHEFGTYHELVLIYDRDELDSLEYSDDTEEVELFNLFWNWFNEVESIDLETEEITEEIRKRYLKTIDFSKAEHLRVEKSGIKRKAV